MYSVILYALTCLPAEYHLLVNGPRTAWWRRLDIVRVILELGHTLQDMRRGVQIGKNMPSSKHACNGRFQVHNYNGVNSFVAFILKCYGIQCINDMK